MMPQLFTLSNCLALSLLLVLIGLYGVLTRRSLLLILLSIEVMLNGINLSFIAFDYFRFGQIAYSHYLYMLSIGVAAVEASIGLAMAIVIFRNQAKATRDQVSNLSEVA